MHKLSLFALTCFFKRKETQGHDKKVTENNFTYTRKRLLKLGMVVRTCNPSTWEKEDQELKASLNYTMTSRPAWPIWDPVPPKKPSNNDNDDDSDSEINFLKIVKTGYSAWDRGSPPLRERIHSLLKIWNGHYKRKSLQDFSRWSDWTTLLAAISST